MKEGLYDILATLVEDFANGLDVNDSIYEAAEKIEALYNA